MSEVGGKSVRYVNRCMGNAAQGQTEFNARRGHKQARKALHSLFGFQPQFALMVGECGGRIAQRAGYPDVVANLCSITPQSLAGRHFTDDGDIQRDQAAARGVTADDLDAMLLRQAKKATRKALDKFFVCLRQCDGKQRIAWCRAHCGQVRQVDCHGFMTNRAGAVRGRKMSARDQHVGGNRQFHAGRGFEQGAIVAHAQHRRRGGAGEVFCDQVKFAGHGVRLNKEDAEDAEKSEVSSVTSASSL